MLIAQKLHKRYGEHTALHSLDLTVPAGELYALLGPNGAGKTTTINCFLGFLTPDGGQASIDGLNVVEHPLETKRRLAYIPEQVNLYGHFTGVENLAYFAELGGHRYDDAQLRAFLVEAGLQADAHDRRVSGYSKGMRQKVGIAIALAKQAKALLLDEPTSGLDPSASHEFSQLLHKLRERGVAILMATHDLFRAKEDATRVGIMRHGQLVRELSAAEISHTDLEKLYLETMRA
ncbi:ABC transporter ATP-binding protein [Oleiharenicola lentus]|uniref:ABC transporter ATP-binding protein n=1 Tax=Oleiharenicola lentus TaxID=2508720 RepID=UPI003F664DF1